METKEIKVFDYTELSETARETARNDFIENNELSFLEDELKERLEEELNKYNIEFHDLELRYSLGYCQGDGLSFIGNCGYKDIDFILSLNDWGNHYQHNKTVDIEISDEDDETDDLSAEVKQVKHEDALNEFKELYFKITDELEKVGYEIIEYEHSDEAIKENCDANEYKFYEDGRLF